MYFSAESPMLPSEDSYMSENNNKGFENFTSELCDMDSNEISYQDIFNTTLEDQAVPDYLSLSTPVTSAPVMTSLSQPFYVPQLNLATGEAHLHVPTTSYQDLPAYGSLPAVPSHVPVIPTSAEQSPSRGPVIMESTVPEQKPRRKGGRKPKNDPLPPHLEERRRLRRIRNKEAAQKCRERRLAHTDTLLKEIEELEESSRYYENLINKMRECKDQCEFILNSHRATCTRNNKRTILSNGQSYHPYAAAATSCSLAHRRSSSSEGELQSPTFIL